jgi:hypothetical protein
MIFCLKIAQDQPSPVHIELVRSTPDWTSLANTGLVLYIVVLFPKIVYLFTSCYLLSIPCD